MQRIYKCMWLPWPVLTLLYKQAVHFRYAATGQVDVLLRVQARDQGRVHQPSPSVAGNCGIASNSSYPCVCNSKEKPGSRYASQAFFSTGSEHRTFIVEVLGFPFPSLERMV